MVLLDQDRVVEAHAVVSAAARGNRRLLERPQARRGLPRVEDRCIRPPHRVDESGGERGDPGQVAEQVERRPFGCEERSRRAAREGHIGRHRVSPPPLRLQPLEALRAGLGKRLGGGLEAEEDPGLLLRDACPGARTRRDGRL